ncbi:MAG: ABC transporter ATP-binding protein [Candidatus Brocadiia bacterium]
MQPVMSVNNCSFSYGEGEFRLQDVTLDVHAGEMLGIVGPNGSGKSTLLRIMAGLLSTSTGEVTIDEHPVSSMKRRDFAREVAFLPQSPESSFEFTVREVVALGRHPYQGAFGLLTAGDQEVISEALAETESENLGNRFFSSLSGGEKQRVLVASVLAQEPRVLLLDEPSASLDIHHKSHVFDLLWTISRREMAVVVVTHDLNTASRYCDVLALLHQGSLERKGKPEEVMNQELLASAYDTPVKVVGHPVTGKPMVLVLGKKTREQNQT